MALANRHAADSPSEGPPRETSRLPGMRHGMHLPIGACFRVLRCLCLLPWRAWLCSAAPVNQLGQPPWRKVGEGPPRACFPNLHAPFNMNHARLARRSHMLLVGGYTRDLQPNLSGPISACHSSAGSILSVTLPFVSRRAVPSTPSKMREWRPGVCHAPLGQTERRYLGVAPALTPDIGKVLVFSGPSLTYRTSL